MSGCRANGVLCLWAKITVTRRGRYLVAGARYIVVGEGLAPPACVSSGAQRITSRYHPLYPVTRKRGGRFLLGSAATCCRFSVRYSQNSPCWTEKRQQVRSEEHTS